MENNTQAAFIIVVDKGHMTMVYVTFYHYFGLQLQMSRPFLNEQTEYFEFRFELLTGAQFRVSQSNCSKRYYELI